MMFSKPMRNHIAIIPEQIGAVGVIFITFVFSTLFETVSSGYSFFSKQFWVKLFNSFSYGYGMGEIILPVVLVAAMLLILCWLFFRWLKTFFYIDGEYLVTQRNTLMKKQARVPVAEISTVNLERNVFERLVGTAKIKLDLNSAATANKTDFTFVLSLDKAMAFEQELLRIKGESTVKESGEASETQAKKTVYAFSAFQVIRHVLLSNPVGHFVAFVVAFLALAEADRSFFHSQINRELMSLGTLTVFGWVTGAVAQLMSLWNFKIERDEKGIYISSGMFKKRSYSFETEKINALVIKRPLLGRFAGLSSAEVAVIGLGNDKKETPQISLLLNQREIEKILNVCAGDFECNGTSVKEHGAGIVPPLFGYLLAGVAVAAAFSKIWVGFFAVCALIAVLLACLSHSSKSLRSDEKIFSYTCGFFSKNTCFFKFSDIQTFQSRTGVVMKRLGLGRIRLSILSSSQMSTHTTGWFSLQFFEELQQKFM